MESNMLHFLLLSVHVRLCRAVLPAIYLTMDFPLKMGNKIMHNETCAKIVAALLEE
jgi:hypothetical protein